MPELRPACCGAGGITRREFVGYGLKSAALLAFGFGATACATQPSPLPRTAGDWELHNPAPFTRHAHSGTVVGRQMLVMGDRKGVSFDDEAIGGEADLTLTFYGTEFDFDSDDVLDIPSGVPVRVVFVNEGLIDHDITFPEAGVYLRAGPGKSAETVTTFEEPELFFCSIGGHAEAGMIGELRVDGKGPEQETIEPLVGETEMWWYDPGVDSWSPAPVLPHSYDHVSMVAVNDDAYVIGGYTGDIGSSRSDVLVLRRDADTWEHRAPFPIARGAMAADSDGETILVAGGRSEAEGTPSSTEIYRYLPEQDQWEQLNTAMPTGRDHVAGAFVDGIFWVVGGRGDGRRVSSTPVTEGFDTSTGGWVSASPPPVPSRRPSQCLSASRQRVAAASACACSV